MLTAWHNDEKLKKSFVDRLEGHRKAEDSGCWTWTGTKNGSGYGVFKFKSKMFYVHRISYELKNGELPNRESGLCLDHVCKNRLCFNPDHLRLITLGQNTKNRRTYVGANNPAAKISEEIVKAIRARYKFRKVTYPMVAKEFGVSASLVAKIIQGRIWS